MNISEIKTMQNYQHSARKYETLSLSTLNTKIFALTKQQIKIKQNNDFLVVDTLGVILEETILHPQGGGQPADTGFINEIPIISVKENKTICSSNGNPTIYHFIDEAFLIANNITVTPTQNVTIILNMDTRLTHALLHSAGHLIADIIEQNPIFSNLSAKAVRGHHFPNEAYIKVLIYANIQNRDEFIRSFNECLAQEIKNDWPISFYNDNHIRHIKIGNLARKCGGTHVLSTGQIKSCIVEKIKISEPPNKNNEPFELTIFYAC